MKTYVIIAAKSEWEMYERYVKENAEKMAHVKGILSGMGKSSTYLTLAQIAHENDDLKNVRIVNIGLCGSSVKGDDILNIVTPANFLDADRDNTCEFTRVEMFPEDAGHAGATIMSSSKFVTKPPIEGYFDMEAFCVNAFCRRFGSSPVILKIVSDKCNEESYLRATPEKVYQVFKKAMDSVRW